MRLGQKSASFCAHLMETEGNKSTFIVGCMNISRAYACDQFWAPAATDITVESNGADAQAWQVCHSAGDGASLAKGLWRLHLLHEMLCFCCAFRSPLGACSPNTQTVNHSKETGYSVCPEDRTK